MFYFRDGDPGWSQWFYQNFAIKMCKEVKKHTESKSYVIKCKGKGKNINQVCQFFKKTYLDPTPILMASMLPL